MRMRFGFNTQIVCQLFLSLNLRGLKMRMWLAVIFRLIIVNYLAVRTSATLAQLQPKHRDIGYLVNGYLVNATPPTNLAVSL